MYLPLQIMIVSLPLSAGTIPTPLHVQLPCHARRPALHLPSRVILNLETDDAEAGPHPETDLPVFLH